MNRVALRESANDEGEAGFTRAPLLSELLTPPQPDRRRVIADLGAVHPGILAALAGTRARLVVVDLPARRSRAPKQWHRIESVLSQEHWHEPVDAVLCWDLLNYLDASALAELARALRERAAPNCRIHALIQYSALDMPAEPGRIVLDADLSVAPRDDAVGPEPRPSAPRYSPKALEKAMPSLAVERTMLLGNGMQEFVFSPRNDV